MISNPLSIQNATTPTKRISTRQTTMEQPSCSKTTDPSTTCIYRRKEPPKPNNHENSEDWIRRTEQPRNEKGQFTSPPKNTGNLTDLNLSIVSDDEFNCNNNSDDKPIHTNVEDELQIHSKEPRLTLETGINHDHVTTISKTPIRRSRRLLFAKQTEKLGSIPYQTNKNRKRIKPNHDLLQENRTRPPENNEEEEDRNIRTNTSNKSEIYRIIRNQHQTTPQLQTHEEGGNVTCEGHTTKRASIEFLTNKLLNV